MKFRQCKLSRGNTKMTTWLEEKQGLKQGVIVEIDISKSKPELWKVDEIGAMMEGNLEQDFGSSCEYDFWYDQTHGIPPEYVIG